jgi:alpha,alpha-trehalase
MAGTVDIVQRCYSGLETRGDVLWFNPSLPAGLRRLHFDIEYRRHWICVEIDKDRLRLTSRPQDIAPISVGFKGEVRTLSPGAALEFDLG